MNFKVIRGCFFPPPGFHSVLEEVKKTRNQQEVNRLSLRYLSSSLSATVPRGIGVGGRVEGVECCRDG